MVSLPGSEMFLPTPIAKQDVGQEQVAGGAGKAEKPANNDVHEAEKESQLEARATDDSRPASQVFLSPQRPPLPTETSCKHQGRKGWKWKGGAEDRGEGSECRKGVLAWVLGALFGGHW
jgi:hypothetical protein